jgi:hypothetical protein
MTMGEAKPDSSRTREERMAMITPVLPRRRTLPKVQIATCCEGEEYLCACINGSWHEVFVTKIADDPVKKISTFTVKSRLASKCRICQTELAEAKTRVYHFGDSEALDDNFADAAARMEKEQAVKPAEGSEPS